MKSYFRSEWPFILLLFVLISITGIYFSLLNNGFCTAWDESYFLLKLKEAYQNSYITGKSQWNLLAIHWFPYLDLVNPIHSRIAIWVCIVSASIVSTLSLCVVYGKQYLLRFFTISYLLFFMIPTTYAGESLNYVPMQSFLVCSAFCIFGMQVRNNLLQLISPLIVGIFMEQALFVIMPSGILLLACFFLMYAIYNKWTNNALLLLGVFLSIIYVHYFVSPISDIIEAMKFTATYISKSGYGYTPLKFVVSILLFFRDWLIVLLAVLGAYYTSIKLQNRWTRIICFVIPIIILCLYLDKPRVTVSELISILLIIPAIDYLTKNQLSKQKFSFYLHNLFLFFFPIIATVGTNTYYGTRMICFIISWLWLFVRLIKEYKVSYSIPLPALCLLFICLLLNNTLPSYIQRLNTRDTLERFTDGNDYFAKLEITKDQKDYLTSVNNIMKEYNFIPNQSVIFTSEYDYATVYALDGKLSSNFYQKNNFLYAPVDKMIEPDFIFLCQWDIDVIGTHLAEMPWGWPDAYDKYYVGSPEGRDFPWDANRWLYCKKELRK